jgi:hypothetical protein
LMHQRGSWWLLHPLRGRSLACGSLGPLC